MKPCRVRKIFKRILSLAITSCLFATASLYFTTAAYADDGCNSLVNNDQWNTAISDITNLIESKQYEEALARAREVYPICPKSPVLNYLVAHCLKESGDKVKALQLYQVASDSTFELATPPVMAQKIWYARYELEYPERTAENVKSLQESNAALESKNRELELTLAATKAADTSASDAIGMWTGAGLGIAGIALGAAFGYLAFVRNDHQEVILLEVNNSQNLEGKAEFNTEVALYWGLFGAGIALAATGAVLTGIFGYRYTHPKTNTDIAFSITPTSASLSLNF